MANEDDFPTQFLTDPTGTATPRAPTPAEPLNDLPENLEMAEPLGEGGMGLVFRVVEPELKRSVALKTLRQLSLERPERIDRFLREAQTTAQLQHPGIIAIHRRGTLPDGRPYFLMPEIRGEELAVRIRSHHATGSPDLRALVRVLRRACEPLAYAHAHGVVHRDFKPENTMIGLHGEVLVLDWGLAKRSGDPDEGPPPSELAIESPTLTRTGAMLGTPVYMAPEQITGRDLSPRSDVYAIGAVLYEILNGHPPRVGTLPQVLNQTLEGATPPPSAGPQVLTQLVDRCLASDPADRPEDAAAVGEALEAWLEGAQRRSEADVLVQQAHDLAEEERSLRRRGDTAEIEAEALLEPLGPYATEVLKAPGWALQDEATACRQRADRLHHRVEHLLWSALARDPEHPEVRSTLSQRFREDHARAERRRDVEGVTRSREALLAQLPHLPLDEREAHASYLDGLAVLTLDSEPSGATVTCRPITERMRLRLEGEPRSLGTTPLVDHPLPQGSWMLELSHPDCETVRYPVFLERQGSWNRTPPGEATPSPVPLPRRGTIPEGFEYIPEGWFTAGGDPSASRAPPATQLWCHGMVMKRDPVTNREYLVFLDALVAQGRHDEARRFSPRDYHERPGEFAVPIWSQKPDGTWFISPDPDGDLWDPDWPVMMIDMASSVAYAEWFSKRSGVVWRLPSEFEWEKAARGVDGRIYPWGDHLDLTWTSIEFHEGSALTRADERPRDCSPYRIRQMGGAVGERCLESRDAPVPVEGSRVVVPPLDLTVESHSSRGGSWSGPRHAVRSATRGFTATHRGFFSQGFRLVRTWTAE